MADNIVYIDVDDGLRRIMDNTKLYAKLLIKFKEDLNLNNLEDALVSGDIANAKIYAHTIKGIAANLSLIELQKQALEIESQIKSGSINPEQINIVKNIYNQTIKEVDKVIEKYA
jgi:HPt (histidine-containing phosphotransfer) domain-containing protein